MFDTLPAHLRDLLENTTRGQQNLIAAWPGLSIESQIMVLGRWDIPAGTSPLALRRGIPEAVVRQAFASPNAYVRYLAVWRMSESLRGEFSQQISSDPDPLVRSTKYEHQSWSLGDDTDCDEFLDQPLEVRLAYLGPAGGFMDTETFVRLVRRAVWKGVVEVEIVAMVQEYVTVESNLSFASHDPGRDGLRDYYIGQRFDALWGLIPDVPLAVAHVLVSHLPAETKAMNCVSDETLDHMNSKLLETLFDRDDVRISHIRQRIALTHPVDADDFVIEAAISRHTGLADHDFASLLRHDQPRLKRMSGAVGMRLVLLRAAEDLFAAIIDEGATADRFASTYRGRLLRGQFYPREVRDLRLYLLAKQLVASDTTSTQWLREFMTPSDPWETYCRLKEKTEGRPRGWSPEERQRLRTALPLVSDLPEPPVRVRLRRIERATHRLNTRLAQLDRLETQAVGTDRRVLIMVLMALAGALLLRATGC